VTLPGRADLVRILHAHGEAAFEAAADRLGYVPTELRQELPAKDEAEVEDAVDAGRREPRRSLPALEPRAATPFYRVVGRRPKEVAETVEPPRRPPRVRAWTEDEWASRGEHRLRPAPAIPELESWSGVGPRLVAALESAAGVRVDLEALVERLARAEPLATLPRRPRVAGPKKIWLLLDRSFVTRPLLADQEAVATRLWQWFGPAIIEPFLLPRGALGPGVGRSGRRFEPAGVESGDVVLAISELGVFGDEAEQLAWRALGATAAHAGGRLLALVPAPGRGPRPEPPEFQLVAWGRSASGSTPVPLDAGARSLLARASYAMELQAGLLRHIRVGVDGLGVEHELAAWNHPDVEPQGEGVGLQVRAHEEHRRAFAELSRAERQRCVDLQALWRRLRPPEVWAQELMALQLDGHGDLRPHEMGAPETLMLGARASLDEVGSERLGALVGWFGDFTTFAPSGGQLRSPELARAMAELWVAAERQAGSRWPVRSPAWVDPSLVVDRDRRLAVRRFRVEQARGQLAVSGRAENSSGSWLADIEARGPSMWCSEVPSWAREVGRDQYGRWARVEVKGVSFRLRWIEPGTFWMGSPEDEAGRFGDEGPRHEVTLTQGFWLGEVPCTQALWRAVTGEAPSRFEGALRPVERVSWDEVQAFLTRINAAVPGLELTLPTEAQWEYAARAGSEEARYGALDDVAWHVGNGGGETHAVGGKAANAWGLQDMLGNVHEWCMDGASGDGPLDAYLPGHATDPYVPGHDRPARVVRGGSWGAHAQRVRAAYRYAYPRGARLDRVGFRVARGQAPSQSGAEPRPPPLAGPRGTREAVPGGVRHLSLETHARLPVDFRADLQLETDLETVTLARLERPEWADGVGRDRYGLFTDVDLPPVGKAVVPVSFRMRWIPPGRFWMGSPDGEEGRSDREVRHQVTLTQGFWLADVPCTQAVWSAVLGPKKNRSKFRLDERPVESVSFDDVQAFLAVLAQRVPDVRLPTEAEWEYACRAGTETATYAGDLRNSDRDPGLDAIAWYGGNSGGIELKNGQETVLKERGAGTHPVRAKAPNPWGLYDMLGNVYEWCLDGADSYLPEAYAPGMAMDPYVPGHERPLRVVRGGSWLDHARYVRAASRLAYPREDRFDLVGFRVARGPVPQPPEGSAGGAGPGAAGLRGEGRARGTPPRRRPKGERS
jgi:formylglycine-generating enzyme required for sulfatase activity